MTTKEDKPVSGNRSSVERSGFELIDAHRRLALKGSEKDTPKKDEPKKDQTVSEVKEEKIDSEEKPAKGLNKLKSTFLIVVSATLVAIVIGYFGIKNFSGPRDSSKPDQTVTRKSNTMSPQREKPDIQRDSSTHQNIYEARKKLSHVKVKSPEKNVGLPQPDKAISERKPILFEQASQPGVALELIEGVDKIVPYFADKEGEMEKERARVLSYPYSVYLGSFRTRKRVKRADSIYRKMGLSPYWIKVDLGDKGAWFRVFTGSFKNKEEADAFIEENQIKEAKAKRTRYATLIGTYTSKEELETKRLALLELGYSAYIIDGINGENRLYSGAFFQKVSAEKHSANLASKGIQSQVVRR
ncbi:MAG: SPOR domain-containing protein [Desulfatiglandales bacterium]